MDDPLPIASFASSECSVSGCNLVEVTNESFVWMLNDSWVRTQTRAVPEPPVYILVTATVFYVIIFFIGVLGNICVIIVVINGKKIGHSIGLYLVNLCLADLLVLFICMPPVLVELYTKEVWYFGHFLCKLVPFLESAVASASVFTIIAISVERYRVVWRPLLVIRKMKNKLATGVTIVVWVVALIINAPLLSIIKYKDSSLLDGTPVKVCRVPVTSDTKRAYIVALSQVSYFVPCVLLAALYVRLCSKLMPNSQNLIEVCQQKYRDKLLIRRQVVNTIASIVLLFFLCHLPYRVLSLWIIFASNATIQKLGFEAYLNVLSTARALFYLNHALNPIVYNFVSKRFRGRLKLLFRKAFRRGSGTSGKRILNRKFSIKSRSQNKEDGNILDQNKISSNSSSSQRRCMNDFCVIYKNIAERTADKCPAQVSRDPAHLYIAIRSERDEALSQQKQLIIRIT